jgi:tryptophan-rich sensory protein
MTQTRSYVWPLIVAVLLSFAVSAAGGALTDIGPWYEALRKPWSQPPNWLFAPVWSLIFSLCAVSAAIGWVQAPTRSLRGWVFGLFALNAVFNLGWSLLFFRFKHPEWALGEVFLLWGSTLILIVFLRRFAPVASLLLWPYLAWVTFATWLNLNIIWLN